MSTHECHIAQRDGLNYSAVRGTLSKSVDVSYLWGMITFLPSSLTSILIKKTSAFQLSHTWLLSKLSHVLFCWLEIFFHYKKTAIFWRTFRRKMKSSEYTDGIPRKLKSVGIFRGNSEENCVPRKKPMNSEEIL